MNIGANEDESDDEDPDRLVIDLDHSQSYRNVSDYSVSSDPDRTHSHRTDDGCSADGKNESRSVWLSSSETNKPPGFGCSVETTSGGKHVTMLTAFRSRPVDIATCSKSSVRSELAYSDTWTAGEDQVETMTSTANASSSESVDRQQNLATATVHRNSASSVSGRSANVTELIATTAHTTTATSTTVHSDNTTIDHRLRRVEV